MNPLSWSRTSAFGTEGSSIVSILLNLNSMPQTYSAYPCLLSSHFCFWAGRKKILLNVTNQRAFVLFYLFSWSCLGSNCSVSDIAFLVIFASVPYANKDRITVFISRINRYPCLFDSGIMANFSHLQIHSQFLYIKSCPKLSIGFRAVSAD